MVDLQVAYSKEPVHGLTSETMVFAVFRGDAHAESRAWQIFTDESESTLKPSSLVSRINLGYPSSSGPLSVSVFENEVALKPMESNEIKLFKLCQVWEHYDPSTDEC